jgi:hypothetical protein
MSALPYRLIPRTEEKQMLVDVNGMTAQEWATAWDKDIANVELCDYCGEFGEWTGMALECYCH